MVGITHINPERDINKTRSVKHRATYLVVVFHNVDRSFLVKFSVHSHGSRAAGRRHSRKKTKLNRERERKTDGEKGDNCRIIRGGDVIGSYGTQTRDRETKRLATSRANTWSTTVER